MPMKTEVEPAHKAIDSSINVVLPVPPCTTNQGDKKKPVKADLWEGDVNWLIFDDPPKEARPNKRAKLMRQKSFVLLPSSHEHTTASIELVRSQGACYPPYGAASDIPVCPNEMGLTFL